MSLKHMTATLAVGALLVGAPAALASGSGTGNSSTGNTTSTSAGGPNSLQGGTSSSGTASGGQAGGGGQSSGNSSAAPPQACTISTMTESLIGFESGTGLAGIVTNVVIPSGCPNHSVLSINDVNTLTGLPDLADVFHDFFLATAPSGNANTVSPGLSKSFEDGFAQFSTPYTVQAQILNPNGQVLYEQDQSVTTAAAPS